MELAVEMINRNLDKANVEGEEIIINNNLLASLNHRLKVIKSLLTRLINQFVGFSSRVDAIRVRVANFHMIFQIKSRMCINNTISEDITFMKSQNQQQIIGELLS